ncbi:MAG TPA: type II secretion system F family protein [Edaphobacter sp.]|nr:type II secretion system F family protein [Edaphobacter sp.]
MLLILVLVFTGVFVVLALSMFASGAGASERAKRAIATLDAALASGTSDSRRQVDQMVDVRKDELLSAIPWVNRWLLKSELAPRLRTLLYQADLNWTTSAFLLLSAGCFVVPAFLVYLRTGVVLFSLLTGFALGFAPFAFVSYKRKQRFNKFEEGLPEALDLMVNGLRAGHSLISVLGLVGSEAPEPVGSEFRSCCEEQNYGLELRTALDNMIVRVPIQDLKLVTTAIMIQKESGGNLPEVLDKTAYVIRERFRLKRQVRVHTAQGRLTAWILSLLPLVLGVGLYLLNPDSMSLLWRRPLGVKLLYAAAGMMITGSLIIRKIVRMDV